MPCVNTGACHPAPYAAQTLKHACRRVGIAAWPRSREAKRGLLRAHSSNDGAMPDMVLHSGVRRGAEASAGSTRHRLPGPETPGTPCRRIE